MYDLFGEGVAVAFVSIEVIFSSLVWHIFRSRTYLSSSRLLVRLVLIVAGRPRLGVQIADFC